MYINYVHYSRLKTISLDEASSLLAHFELRSKNITDPGEYDKLFSKEKRLANIVLSDANSENSLDCYRDDGVPSDVKCYFFTGNELNPPGYDLKIIRVRVADFCKWAKNQKYNLPDELIELSGKGKKDREGTEIPKAAVEFRATVAQQEIQIETEKSQKTANKSGPKKCTLSLAVEIAYLKLRGRGDVAVLKPGMRDAFMECFREIATDGNINSDDDVLKLIKEITKTRNNKYIIVTHDRYNEYKPLQVDEISIKIEKGDVEIQVTRFLNNLRKAYPLT